MPFIGSGLITDHFGLGFSNGDLEWHTDADVTGDGDQVARNIIMTKTNPGDPSFTVLGYGQRYVATRKITIGTGVTLLGNSGAPGGNFSLGAPGTTLGFGGDGGLGGIGSQAGAAGTTSGSSRGGSGGSGGTGGAPNIGGSGGLASVSNFKGMYRNAFLLLNGFAVVNGVVYQLSGGMGGGGGGATASSGGANGGGGGGIIVLEAPLIEIAGIVDMRGLNGTAGNPDGPVGGGGGGGGGMLICICGKLSITGSVLLNGGNGAGAGGGGSATGGTGGNGGRMWVWTGGPEDFTETVGSAGANG